MTPQKDLLHPVVPLSRYFSWASYIKGEFDNLLEPKPLPKDWTEPRAQKLFMFMSHWYATLYVVIEGFRALKLQDPEINRLTKSSLVGELKLYRNGVYHFQRTYFDKRFTGFMDATDSSKWARQLHKAFFDYFAAWFKAHNLDGSLKT